MPEPEINLRAIIVLLMRLKSGWVVGLSIEREGGLLKKIMANSYVPFKPLNQSQLATVDVCVLYKKTLRDSFSMLQNTTKRTYG